MERNSVIITGIVVLYNPEYNLLKKSIDSVYSQLDYLYVIDNTKGINHADWFQNDSKILYTPLSDNLGIAEAQNIALDKCLDKSDFIFFLDQDSITPDFLIESLLNKFFQLKKSGVNVGAIGPRPYNRDEGKKYLGSIKKGIPIGNNLSEVSELINSASLIPVEAFRKAGLMDSTLFIDGVDHEWCWRAKYRGNYRFFIDEDTLLSHKLGEGDRHFLWKKVAIPTPFRTYYQYRNFFRLLKRGYVPTYWKVSNAVKYAVKLFYYPLFISPRKEYLRNIFNGIVDGITMSN
ncbi:MAG: glycosyltransferase family 2 protein [Duncaniella sp.]|nr:glycosyltransferase family 2 protein [Duncaniella sp.]